MPPTTSTAPRCTLEPVAAPAPGLRGFLAAVFIIHYGAMPWSVGPLVVAGLAVRALALGRWAELVAVAAFVALPYSPLYNALPWRRLHGLFMRHFPTSPAYASASFNVDPDHPLDLSRAASSSNTSDSGAHSGYRRPVLLAYSPHGIFCHAFSGSHGTLHPGLNAAGVKFLLANPLFHAPVFRHLVVSLGNIGSASRASMERLMAAGVHVALLPGGLEEASLTTPGAEAVFVTARLGFIKLALRHGYTIRPVYSFGEAGLFRSLLPAWLSHRLRFALARRGLPVVAPLGRWWAPFMPVAGATLHTYVGRPVHCARTAEADLTDALVRATHARYVAELLRLFDEHKHKHGCAGASLELH